MTDRLRANGNVNDSLSSAARHGGAAEAEAPALLRRVLEEETWREFVTQRGDLVRPANFAEFITRPPLKGLGASIDWIAHVAKTDPVLLDLYDRAMQGKPGRPKTPNNVKGYSEGNAEAAALRRLRKDAPELHAEVLTGRLSAHAAMVQAGYRPRTISVPVERPDAIARALLKHMKPEDLAALKELL